MSKIRVFQNLSRRRNPYIYGSLLLFFLFFPYIITVLLGNSAGTQEEAELLMIMEQLRKGHFIVNNETGVGRESIPIEIYVADKLMRTMEENYEEEALKAQAVLLRAELVPDEGFSITVSDEDYGKSKVGKKYLMAVAHTRGIYPEYDGKPIYGAYCRVSNGRTRLASEVLTSDEYPYLVSVPCESDFLSEEYAAVLSFGKREFEDTFQNIEETMMEEDVINRAKENGRYEEKNGIEMIRDSAGYVLFLKYQDKWIAGEGLRYALNLPSASFDIEENKGEIIFNCKGKGHGMGFCQFAANEMAVDGKNYIEILNYFFENITLTKTE